MRWTDFANLSNRDDPKKNRSVVCHSLRQGDDNVMCPIKLLLVLALRLGNVAATNIDDLLTSTQSCADKTIKWTHPERPVMCAIGRCGAKLDVDEPASSEQLTSILGQAGLAAGVLAKIRSHDIRRGAARDSAQLDRIDSVSSVEVATTLGHSFKTYSTGVTADYIGDVSDDT